MTVMAELARARTKLIHRMPSRGDLWMFVDQGAMFLRADQVEALAGIPPWAGGELLVDVDDWTILDGHACYPVEAAIARCESAATPTAAAFLNWLVEVIDQVDDDALDQAQATPGFIGSFPVEVAARMLSEAPEVTVGRNGLFVFMDHAGWVSRGQADWEITHAARRNGWLTIRHVPVPGRARRPYPQVYVTPAGLAELQQILTNGRRRTPPDPPRHPTLFD